MSDEEMEQTTHIQSSPHGNFSTISYPFKAVVEGLRGSRVQSVG